MLTFSDTFFRWIDEHAKDDCSALRLKYGRKDEPIDYAAAITQIECRRKFAQKLKQTLTTLPRFFFPSVLAGEQATADIVAAYHAGLLDKGVSMVDLTTGLGIDAIHAASVANEVVAIERDPERVEALKYNCTLKNHNIKVVEADCIDYLASAEACDVMFIDPARRASDGGRVFALSDCEPNVLELLPRISETCKILHIKASPMLDISHTIESLPFLPKTVAAVGTPTECKELLITIDFKNGTEQTVIQGVTLSGDIIESFNFTRSEEESAPTPPSHSSLKDGEYIYELWPSVMKTGAFKIVAQRFGLEIFHPNTKIFVSSSFVENFPGSVFKVEKALPYASKHIKRFKKEYPLISVAARNFGMSAEALRSKLGVNDGGELKVYGLTDARNERLLAVVRKVD